MKVTINKEISFANLTPSEYLISFGYKNPKKIDQYSYVVEEIGLPLPTVRITPVIIRESK